MKVGDLLTVCQTPVYIENKNSPWASLSCRPSLLEAQGKHKIGICSFLSFSELVSVLGLGSGLEYLDKPLNTSEYHCKSPPHVCGKKNQPKGPKTPSRQHYCREEACSACPCKISSLGCKGRLQFILDIYHKVLECFTSIGCHLVRL